jgi:hypothetical protein
MNEVMQITHTSFAERGRLEGVEKGDESRCWVNKRCSQKWNGLIIIHDGEALRVLFFPGASRFSGRAGCSGRDILLLLLYRLCVQEVVKRCYELIDLICPIRVRMNELKELGYFIAERCCELIVARRG